MRIITTTGAVLIGMCFALPIAAFAEEGTASVNAEAGVTLENNDGTPPPPQDGTKPVPMLLKIDGHASLEGGKGPGNIPPGAMMKGGIMASGTKPMPKGLEMRDKMTASGTRPLPPGMDGRMEGRDGDHMRMMGSGTPERMERGDCPQTGSSSDCGDRRGKEGHRGEMMKRAAEVLFNRIDAAIKRFNKIADRIDSRIAKLDAEGTDTASAEASVTLGRAKTKAAQDALDAAKALIDTASANSDASSTPGDSGKPVREQLEKAKQALMDAAKALGDAISSIKIEGGANGQIEMHNGTSSPKIPGMMRTKDHMSTGTPDGHPDGSL